MDGSTLQLTVAIKNREVMPTSRRSSTPRPTVPRSSAPPSDGRPESARPAASGIPAPRRSETRGSDTRRTEGVRNQGRAARVVADVLRATAEQLSRVGFAALRVEDVASLSGVNKTTIYRRWPSRSDLVAATLRALKPGVLADTGTLRGDVFAWYRQMTEFIDSPLGAGIIRMIQTEKAHPELEPIARSMRDEHHAVRLSVIDRAIARGELPEVRDRRVLVDLLFSSISARCITLGEPVDEAYVHEVLDIVTRGSGRGAGERAQS